MVVVFVMSVVLRIYFFHPKTLGWTVYGCLRVVGYIFFVLNFGGWVFVIDFYVVLRGW